MSNLHLSNLHRPNSHAKTLRRRRLLRWAIVLVLSLFAWVGVAQFAAAPVRGQTPIPLPVPTPTSNLNAATVSLNGLPVFEIAAIPVEEGAEDTGLPPAEERVADIERELNAILEEGFDPQTLSVEPKVLNNQPVIYVSDGEDLSERLVVTVTEPDIKLADVPGEELADRWADRIKSALKDAREELRPQAQRRRLEQAIGFGAAPILLSPLLLLLQRRLKRRYEELSRQRHPEDLQPPDESTSLRSGRASVPMFQFVRAMMPQLVLERRISIVVLLRRILLFAQVTLWLGATIGVFYQFPAMRPQAFWLMGLPVQILGIWLVVAVANKVTDVAIDNTLQSWVEQESLNPTASRRFVLRAPTLAAALKGTTSFLAGVIGVFWFLGMRQFPLDSLLTGAGIFGAALTIVFQNLIKDLINGVLILWEDQFAVGDVIDAGFGAGFVEYMNLRVTKLRGDGGRLTTIPNSQINVVHNLTKEWSRIDFRIRIDPQADALEAIQVMKRTMEQMQADPDWTERIFEPTVLIGVERIDERGTEILMWTKTKPIEQWNVAREYRRRLKLAFDAAGIHIAVPQQSLWLHEERHAHSGDRAYPPSHSLS